MTIEIKIGDCRDVLKTMPDKSVNMCVTSPPYFGLRDYDVDGQMGLESTPDEFVAALVEVFREVRRVLRDDGTLFLNLGDSYAGSGKGGNPGHSKHVKQATNRGSLSVRGVRRDGDGLKPKDLIGIPWLVAFALRADGWYLRKDIIWAKPNAMPESVVDRPTSSHEHVFLFAKSGKPTIWRSLDTGEWNSTPDLSETMVDDEGKAVSRWRGFDYYYDADAIREAESVPDWDDGTRVFGGVNKHGANAKHGARTTGRLATARKRGVPPRHSAYESSDQSGLDSAPRGAGRNSRDVWTIATRPFPEAHFATFPPDLPERCIKAGCPVGGTVLDPFGGAGTTGMVADRLGRNAILIELNPTYVEIIRDRIHKDAGMFGEIA